MKSIALAVLLLLVFTPSVLAQFTLTPFTTISCSSNQTLFVETNETRCIDGVCKEFAITTEQFCNYGCTEENVQPQCQPAPFEVNVFFIIPIIGILLVILLAALWRLTK